MEKITKREMYEAIKESFETGACKFDAETVIAFCEKEIATLDKRSAKAKETAAAKKAEGDVLMNQVHEALTEEFQTIAEVAAVVVQIEGNEDVTAAKVQSRLTKLVDAGIAVKEQISVPASTEGGKASKRMAYKLADNVAVAD